MNKNTTPIYKYRMFVQARSDLTPEEIQAYQDSGKKSLGPSVWPWRDTGEFVFTKRRNNAKAFYREMRKVDPIIKIKAEKVFEPPVSGGDYQPDAESMRAWRGFAGTLGSINNAADEVRHFAANDQGLVACGIQFTVWWPSVGKPQCPACLEAAVAKHPEMKVYL